MVQYSLLVSIERTFDTYLFIVEMYMYIYITLYTCGKCYHDMEVPERKYTRIKD